MDDYGSEIVTAGGDPAAMDFDVTGKPIEDEVPA